MSYDFLASSTIQERRIGDYVLWNAIAKGISVKVSLARHTLTRTEVVLKAISRIESPQFPQEARFLDSLNHPNITKLFEVIATKDKFYLVMEYVRGGDLGDYLEKHGRLSERAARTAFRQLVSAVQYCHGRGIVHRDLKPDNILVEGDLTLKLADFGLGREVSDQKLNTYCGTTYYMAPEIMQCQPYDGCKADVWSLGVTLYKMLTGRVPFPGETFADHKELALTGKFVEPHFLTRQGRSFLKRLLTLNPSKRPTLEEAMKDPWLNMGHKKELRPYSEPAGEDSQDLDPRVIRRMLDLGFRREQIQRSVTQRKLDRVTGTYRILSMTQTKMPGRTVRVRSYRCPDSGTTSSSQEVGQSLDVKTKEPYTPPKCLWLHLTTGPPDLESMTITPRGRPTEVRTATPSPDLQRGPGDAPTRHSRSLSSISSSISSSSSSSREGAPEGATCERCLHPRQPDVGTRAPSSGHSQRRPGLVRRTLKFIFKFTCCRSPTNKKRFKGRKSDQSNV